MAYNDGFRKYEDTEEQRERIFLLNFLKTKVKKEQEKWEKKLKRSSEKLMALDISRDTKRRIASARIKASADAIERDRWERRITIIDGWIKEVRQ